jgi:hypothetical protein
VKFDSDLAGATTSRSKKALITGDLDVVLEAKFEARFTKP